MKRELLTRYLYFSLITTMAFYIIANHFLIVISTGNIFSLTMLFSSLIVLLLWCLKNAHFNYVVMFWTVFVIIKNGVSIVLFILANAYRGFSNIDQEMIIYKILITVIASMVLYLAFKIEYADESR